MNSVDALPSDLKLLLPPSVPDGARLHGLISKLRSALLSKEQSTADNADKFLARRIKARLPSAGVKIPVKYTDAFRKEVTNCTDISALLFVLAEWASMTPDDIALQVLKSNPSRNIAVGSTVNRRASSSSTINNTAKKSVSGSSTAAGTGKQSISIEKKKSVSGSSTDNNNTIEKKESTRSSSTITSSSSTSSASTKSSSKKKKDGMKSLVKPKLRVRRELFKTTGKKGVISLPQKTSVEEGGGARKQINFSAGVPNPKSKKSKPPVPALSLPTGRRGSSGSKYSKYSMSSSPVTPAKGNSTSSSTEGAEREDENARSPLEIIAQGLVDKEREKNPNKALTTIFRNMRMKLAKLDLKAEKDSKEEKKLLNATSGCKDMVSYLEILGEVFKDDPLALGEMLLFPQVSSPRTRDKNIEEMGEEQNQRLGGTQRVSIYTRGKSQETTPVVEEAVEEVVEEEDMEGLDFLMGDDGLPPPMTEDEMNEFIEKRKAEIAEEDEAKKVEQAEKEKPKKKKKKKKKSKSKKEKLKQSEVVSEDTGSDEIQAATPEPNESEEEKRDVNASEEEERAVNASEEEKEGDNNDNGKEEEEDNDINNVESDDGMNAAERDSQDTVGVEESDDNASDEVKEVEESSEEEPRPLTSADFQIESTDEDRYKSDTREVAPIDSVQTQTEITPSTPQQRRSTSTGIAGQTTKAQRRKQRMEDMARRLEMVESRQRNAVSWPTLFCFSSLVIYAVLFYYVFLLD